jgi:dTDP-glucose 4,6-dehydratase
MHYFISGGAGFIGSNYVNNLFTGLYGEFETVTIYDNLNYASDMKNLQVNSRNPKFQFIKGDIENKKLLQKSIKKNSVILHFAAETHVDRSIINPDIFLKSNIVGTFRLLEASLKANCSKFVYISTDEVYGPKINGLSKEGDILLPTSPYASSKASAEMLVHSFHKNFGLRSIITRSCNNYGPNQDKEKLIPKIIHKINKNELIPIYGRGRNVREWIFVNDNCRAIDLVLKKGKVGEIYNIGTGERYSNLFIVKKVLQLYGKSPNLIQFVEDRMAHDFRYALDSSKIRDKLGFKPEYTLESGMQYYIESEQIKLKSISKDKRLQ